MAVEAAVMGMLSTFCDFNVSWYLAVGLLLDYRVSHAQIDGSVGALMATIRANTIDQPKEYLTMGVLALLYTLQVCFFGCDGS